MKKKIIWIIVVLVIVAGAILGLTVFRKGKNGEIK
jgi:flagellar basal body-associated protein FliL